MSIPVFFPQIFIKIITKNKRIYNNPVLFEFCEINKLWLSNGKTAMRSSHIIGAGSKDRQKYSFKL
jgi:hypothetical protein